MAQVYIDFPEYVFCQFYLTFCVAQKKVLCDVNTFLGELFTKLYRFLVFM